MAKPALCRSSATELQVWFVHIDPEKDLNPTIKTNASCLQHPWDIYARWSLPEQYNHVPSLPICSFTPVGLGESTWANYDTGTPWLGLSAFFVQKIQWENKRGKKPPNSDSILSVIIVLQYVSSALFVLPNHSLLFDCCLNPLWVIFLRMVFWIPKWLHLNWTCFPIHQAVGCINSLLNMTILYSFPLAWTVFTPF